MEPIDEGGRQVCYKLLQGGWWRWAVALGGGVGRQRAALHLVLAGALRQTGAVDASAEWLHIVGRVTAPGGSGIARKVTSFRGCFAAVAVRAMHHARLQRRTRLHAATLCRSAVESRL